ncbi:MAG: hypothetical protein JO261_08995, partial [Alphaproteobacteria bacterium]|nr:hypothetical protein [Alphaproteobacteria bacterium]
MARRRFFPSRDRAQYGRFFISAPVETRLDRIAMNTRRIGAAALVVLLGGCSLDVTDFDVSDLRFSKKSSNKAFVVGDEPYAVRTAATLISQGGNAVDAAAAM